jgi:multiple sugar transport system permease protein
MTIKPLDLSTRAITTGGAPRRKPTRRRPLTGILLGLLCVLMLSPFIWMTLSVTKPTDVAFANPPVFSGYTPTLQAFVDLWQTTYFADYLVNTLVVAVVSTVLALVIGIPAAYALSRFPSYVSALLLVLALVFRALPRFAVVLPMYDISKSLGIYDTTFALALALVAINQPFTIWLLRNFFAEIPRELDEAAMIDGWARVSSRPGSSCSSSRSRSTSLRWSSPTRPRRRCRCSSRPSSGRPFRCSSRPGPLRCCSPSRWS